MLYENTSQNQLCCVALCLGKADSFVCLGSAGFLLPGAMETSGVSHTSASVSLLCVIPPRDTFLPLHTLLILSTLSSAGVDFLILHFTATCIHSSISLILHHLLCCWCFSLFLCCISLSHRFPLLYPSRFFHSLHSGPLRFHRVPCSSMHFWGIDLNIICAYGVLRLSSFSVFFLTFRLSVCVWPCVVEWTIRLFYVRC